MVWVTRLRHGSRARLRQDKCWYGRAAGFLGLVLIKDGDHARELLLAEQVLVVGATFSVGLVWVLLLSSQLGLVGFVVVPVFSATMAAQAGVECSQVRNKGGRRENVRRSGASCLPAGVLPQPSFDLCPAALRPVSMNEVRTSRGITSYPPCLHLDLLRRPLLRSALLICDTYFLSSHFFSVLGTSGLDPFPSRYLLTSCARLYSQVRWVLAEQSRLKRHLEFQQVDLDDGICMGHITLLAKGRDATQHRTWIYLLTTVLTIALERTLKDE
ncbi:hypothetical protein B0H12DRAFT_11501 [Mycena haematopus]|nr:hypothetical protein B0H12DRAFT_573383 [Mycena haematopus]KAJ7276257.1 hypothetical protein B0H12DRAFT_11501 [Mycena haematopus]